MANKKFIDIEDIKGFSLNLPMEQIMMQNAEATIDMLEEKSPVSKRNKSKRKRYAFNWKYNYYAQYNMAVVYNKKANLTYLLEHGHISANKRGSATYIAPRKHIVEVFNAIPLKMNKIIKQTDIDFDIY